MPSTIKLPDVYREIHDLNGSTATVKIAANKEFYQRATRRLEPFKALPYQMKPAMEKVADYVRMVMIPRTFKEEGPGWEKLAPMTMGLREAAGFQPDHPILIRTGDLFEELTNKSHPNHIEIIKVGRLARIEIGGSSAKFIENQMGGPRLPARPMIPGTGFITVPSSDKKQMQKIAMEGLIQRLRI